MQICATTKYIIERTNKGVARALKFDMHVINAELTDESIIQESLVLFSGQTILTKCMFEPLYAFNQGLLLKLQTNMQQLHIVILRTSCFLHSIHFTKAVEKPCKLHSIHSSSKIIIKMQKDKRAKVRMNKIETSKQMWALK
jgi:hypothetical protein